MKRIFITIILLVLVVSISAEMSDKFLNPTLYSPTLFDLNNITMNHTISFSGGISSNNQSFYQSIYTNHINYRISSKLNLKLDLNFMNFGSARYNNDFSFDGNGDNQSVILPEFSLSFTPSENFNIVIEYRNVHMQNSWYDQPLWLRD
jgi:hypothetical protein